MDSELLAIIYAEAKNKSIIFKSLSLLLFLRNGFYTVTELVLSIP